MQSESSCSVSTVLESFKNHQFKDINNQTEIVNKESETINSNLKNKYIDLVDLSDDETKINPDLAQSQENNQNIAKSQNDDSNDNQRIINQNAEDDGLKSEPDQSNKSQSNNIIKDNKSKSNSKRVRNDFKKWFESLTDIDVPTSELK